jgi:site-specific DNA-methyltransferase (adenine-specific)
VQTNALYYGDNLGILHDFIPDESVDLIYLDPPFNSNRDYNLIFRDQSGNKADAQILAFEDTWTWGPDASSVYDYLTNTARHHGHVPDAVSQIVAALRTGIGPSEMLAYLVEMTVRLVELHRVLRPTGTLYLHCDPTASHYLKLVLDAIFGPKNFRNEVVWKRTSSHNDSVRFGRVHDVILVYAKTEATKFNMLRTALDESYVTKVYRNVDADGRRYRMDNIMAPGGRGPVYEWHGVTRAWRFTRENMEELYRQGRIRLKADGTANINGFVRYLDENQGQPVQDWWDDIGVIAAPSKERLGYPTQKPVALLERILEASSNPGDIVLDPFCGCGTALVAAQKLGRQWVGIDITYLAIAVMRSRLHNSFGIEAPIIGAPTEVDGARALAEQSLTGRYQFQQWALTLVDAAPAGPAMPKKGADTGIDGKITFTDAGGQIRTVIVSVKSGGVTRNMISDLAGVIQREGAAMGLFITLEEPTAPMRKDAASYEEFYSELAKRSYPKVQILSIRELLDGRKPEIPLLVLPTYQQAEKVQESPGQETMFG